MKIIELIQARKVISKYATQPVDVKLAYKIMKYMKETDDDEQFYYKHADELITKYAKRDEDGNIEHLDNNMIPIQEEHMDDLNKEMQELNETEAKRPNIMFKLDEFEGLKLTASEMLLISEFVEE